MNILKYFISRASDIKNFKNNNLELVVNAYSMMTLWLLCHPGPCAELCFSIDSGSIQLMHCHCCRPLVSKNKLHKLKKIWIFIIPWILNQVQDDKTTEWGDCFLNYSQSKIFVECGL